jgi:hypothetical protein
MTKPTLVMPPKRETVSALFVLLLFVEKTTAAAVSKSNDPNYIMPQNTMKVKSVI